MFSQLAAFDICQGHKQVALILRQAVVVAAVSGEYVNHERCCCFLGLQVSCVWQQPTESYSHSYSASDKHWGELSYKQAYSLFLHFLSLWHSCASLHRNWNCDTSGKCLGDFLVPLLCFICSCNLMPFCHHLVPYVKVETLPYFSLLQWKNYFSDNGSMISIYSD